MTTTPNLSHLCAADFATVYEPAEDTFLLMDALDNDVETIKTIRPLVCLEVGCGSGAISAFVAKLCGPQTLYLCSDINVDAALVSWRTGVQNRVILNPVLADLVGCFVARLCGSVDLLIFNPPYVVTPSQEVGSSGIEASWAGGAKGREVIDRLLPLVDGLLSPTGAFYLVVIRENRPEEIESYLSGYRLRMSVVLSRRAGPEHLSVLRFTRLNTNQTDYEPAAQTL